MSWKPPNVTGHLDALAGSRPVTHSVDGVHLSISGFDRRTPMPRQVRAVVVDPAAPGKLAIKPVELRDPDRNEVAVRVTAISLNRGETRRAVQQAEPGWRPGWDFAGVAETAAGDGSGPRPGTRVVGILPSSAWAEWVNCRTHAVAALPDAVEDAEAATLPVAGLTALHALRQGGLLLGRKVLVDGASGGVGHLACQLAMAAPWAGAPGGRKASACLSSCLIKEGKVEGQQPAPST
jgi:NADPH:quinone reductase-like Zn-dependent oxidoreductase